MFLCLIYVVLQTKKKLLELSNLVINSDKHILGDNVKLCPEQIVPLDIVITGLLFTVTVATAPETLTQPSADVPVIV